MLDEMVDRINNHQLFDRFPEMAKLQIIVPVASRLRFIQLSTGLEVPPSRSKYYFFCYKMNLLEDIIYLK